jgi:hypothetical protein
LHVGHLDLARSRLRWLFTLRRLNKAVKQRRRLALMVRYAVSPGFQLVVAVGSMEWHRGNRSGFIASWPQAGVPIGLALSILAVRIASGATGDNFTTSGWRWPLRADLRHHRAGHARQALQRC